jgi:hypothetical protein
MKINLKKYFKSNEIKEFCSKNEIKYRTFEDIYYGYTKDPRISILYKIAKGLNITIDDLIEE